MWALISTPTLARREIIHESDRYEIITVGGTDRKTHEEKSR